MTTVSIPHTDVAGEPFPAARFIKEIGRGKNGARSMTRDDACALYRAMLDGRVSDLELGGILLSMRIKGESVDEIAGFLDAAEASFAPLQAPAGPYAPIVIPSYNGARKLPVLTPLLALLLAREGLPVLIHGTATESSRVFTSKVLLALDIPANKHIKTIANGEVMFAPTELLCPGLQRLLDVRRVVNLRNSAHSVVKLMNPCVGNSLVVSSYTHPEYALSMAATLELMGANALLLRGTEGEAVADPRRIPRMQGFIAGRTVALQEAQTGPLAALPALPKDIDEHSTAHYIREVLAGTCPVPVPIAQQVVRILHLVEQL